MLTPPWSLWLYFTPGTAQKVSPQPHWLEGLGDKWGSRKQMEKNRHKEKKFPCRQRKISQLPGSNIPKCRNPNIGPMLKLQITTGRGRLPLIGKKRKWEM